MKKIKNKNKHRYFEDNKKWKCLIRQFILNHILKKVKITTKKVLAKITLKNAKIYFENRPRLSVDYVCEWFF